MALVVCGLYHGLFWGRMSDINIFAFFLVGGRLGQIAQRRVFRRLTWELNAYLPTRWR